MPDVSGILFFARDPGPANQVVVAHALVTGALPAPLDPGAEAFIADVRPHAGRLLLAGKGPALAVFERAGLGARSMGEMLDDGPQADVAACAQLLQREAIGAVVTGTTDIDDGTDRMLWRAARALGIKSHAFLDHLANLRVRFAETGDEIVLPDHLYAPDESYRAALVAEGVPVHGLRITGPLHIARVAQHRGAALGRREAVRKEWGASPADRVVLFVSECAAEMAALGRPSDYDEFEALRDLAGRLANGDGGPLGRNDPTRYVLVVRPHPRDGAGKYDQVLPSLTFVRASISAEGSPEEAILAADLIAGMRSTMMAEALTLGRPVIRLIEDRRP